MPPSRDELIEAVWKVLDEEQRTGGLDVRAFQTPKIARIAVDTIAGYGEPSDEHVEISNRRQ